MSSVVARCPCGYVMRDTDREQLAAQIQRHAKEMHGMELTRLQALAMMHPE